MATDKSGNTINFCTLPKSVSGAEAKLYSKLIWMHCSHIDSESSDHKCCGQIAINRKSVTMSCVKCGDSRINLIEKTSEEAA